MTGPPAPFGVALFLDFDGTLVDIAPRPTDVVVEPVMRHSLERLRIRLDGALAIVTGRPIADIDGFLPGLDIDACGLHGLERRVGGQVLPPPDLVDVSAEAAALARRFAQNPGIVVEDKRVGVAVHWRLAPELEAEATAAVGSLAHRLGSGFRVQDGKAVREIVPAEAGKGRGIAALMDVPPYRGRHPVFVGDDRTDEDGFAAVEGFGGTTIKVGQGPTGARFRIAAPADFRAALSGWADGGFGSDALTPA